MNAASIFADVEQDVRYATRVLRRTPVFAAVVVATLALAIGASTAIFTIVESVLLRPLRFAEPQRLVMVRPDVGARLSSAYLQDWRRDSRSLQDMAGWYDVRMNLTGRGEPREVLVDRVTSNFFALLGTPAVLGHAFPAGQDLGRAERQVVLSFGFWQRQFGASPRIVGEAITLDGEPYTVVGVMPDGFKVRTNELAESRAEAWVPFALVPDTWVGMGGVLNVIARLMPPATATQAQAELALIAQRIERQYPSYSRHWQIEVLPLRDATVKDVRLTLLVLFGAVGILLLIACANVASLVLSRAATRQTELAIRASLGATGGRLARQGLAESAMLALAGGALGLALAFWGTRLLIAVLPAGLDLPRVSEIHVDLRVLAFSVTVTMLAAVLFGLMPSLGAARTSLVASLRSSTRAMSAGPDRHRLQSVMIVAEVSLALILAAGAGLLGRSFLSLVRVSPGFQPEHVLTLRTALSRSTYETDDHIRAFGREVLDRLSRLPGVTAVGFANYLPLSNIGYAATFEIEGRPQAAPDERPSSWESFVGGRYLEAMGIPLVRGRLPGPADTQRTPPVFVIDETLASRYWPSEDPIGKHLTWHRDGKAISGEIIAIVGSVRWATIAADPMPTTYLWFPQEPGRSMSVVARVVGDPTTMADRIAAEVRQIDPNQPIAEVRGLRAFVSDDLARPRFTLWIVGAFAGGALLLAALGLYGVMAFGVAQRTQEIGVRIALGAQPRDVVHMVMSRGVVLIGVGMTVGIAGTLALGRLVASLLYEIGPTDVPTLLAVVLVLGAVGSLATWIPARRAAHVAPVVALKAE